MASISDIMTTLDDKLLGEKRDNYCSSSEEENERDEEDGGGASATSPLDRNNPLSSSKIDINSTNRWEGYSQNTGPKGVIRDWQLYKEHEARMRDENQRRLGEEVKKHAVVCSSYGDEVRAKQEAARAVAQAEPDLDIDELLLDDDVLKEFVQKRMEAMMIGGGGQGGGGKRSTSKSLHPWSGSVLEIKTGDEFLKVVDGAGEHVTVVMHIYNNNNNEQGSSKSSCRRMNECLDSLSGTYPTVQFCKVGAGSVGVSSLFRVKGTPALLVYKAGVLIGNFVQVAEELGGDEFYPGDVENFLVEKGVFSEGVGVGVSMIRGSSGGGGGVGK